MYEKEIEEKEGRVKLLKNKIGQAKIHNKILTELAKNCDENE